MKKHITLFLIPLFAVLVLSSGCILEEKVIDIVLSGETCAEFSENEGSPQWNTPVTIDYGEEIDAILLDAGYERSDIKSASLVSASVGVTLFQQSTNWIISGSITVARSGGPAGLIVNYTSASVPALLNVKENIPLEPAGVAIINQALADFIAGQNPVLTFTMNNQGVTPVPDDQSRIIFDWKAWLAIQAIVEETVEVPDPF